MILIVSACTLSEAEPGMNMLNQNDSNHLNDLNHSSAGGNIFAEIFERSIIYENLYIDGDEASENLQNAVSEARRLSVSLLSENELSDRNEEIQQVYDDFDNASLFFRRAYTDIENKTTNSGLINHLYINDVKCAFDRQSDTFYYTMGRTPDKELRFIFYAENADGEKVFAEISDGGSSPGWNFVPELNKEYTLTAHTREQIYDYKIIFTMLPIIQINTDTPLDAWSGTYRNSIISVTDPDFSYPSFSYTGRDGTPVQSDFYFESSAGIRVRGAMARGFPKTSYAIKFWDSSQNNQNVELFGLRRDSDWILDAMAVDRSRVRNRAATDIWHEMSSPLYYEQEGQNIINGTRGVFVEVFFNDEYIGLYCFTEKVDRKQLQLDRNENGLKSIIYKGRHWGDVLLFRTYEPYNNNSSWWTTFEQKYPRPANGGQIEWAPLADFIQFFNESDDEEFAAGVHRYIDMQNFVDYTLFLIISYAYDNTGKNLYWSVYDITDPDMNKIFVTPWDLDGSWGTSWNGEKLHRSMNGPWIDDDWTHDSELFRRLVLTNAGGFADMMRETWERLKHDALSPAAVLKIFDDYFDLFEISGAWDRESVKWRQMGGLNLQEEREFVKEWVEARWIYTDGLIQNRLHEVGGYAPNPPRRRR
jgi:hypothetical protein